MLRERMHEMPQSRGHVHRRTAVDPAPQPRDLLLVFLLHRLQLSAQERHRGRRRRQLLRMQERSGVGESNLAAAFTRDCVHVRARVGATHPP